MPSHPSKASFFSPSDLQKLNTKKIPHHIAIIPDGNRRWAWSHAVTAIMGHKKGLMASWISF